MPEVDHLDTTGFSFSAQPQQPDKPSPAFFTEVIPAAFRQENDVFNTWEYLTRQKQFAPTPGFNPMARLKEMDAADRTDLWARYGNDFVGVHNEDQFAAKLGRIKQENTDRQTLDAAGAAGFIAQIVAGMASPTIALPFMGSARGLKAGVSAAAWGAVGGAVQEVPLALNQETRTVGESAFSIAASTVVSGMLGSAVGVLSRGDRELLERTLESEMGMVFGPGPTAIPRAAGAQAVPEVSPSAGGLAPGVPGLITATSPVLRTIDQTMLPKASWTMAQYSDGGVALAGNTKGIATAAGGSLESLVKTYDAQYVKALVDVDAAYTEYFYGVAGKPALFADARATVGGAFSPAHMNKAAFKEEISKALWSADKHPNPQVQKAAENLRRDFFDPMLQEAQRVGLIPKEIDLKGDISYLTRDYHVTAIRANTNEFIDILAANYEKQAQADYARRLAKFQETEGKTNTLIGDLTMAPEEVAKQKEKFTRDLATLDDSRMSFIKVAEEESASLRQQARAAKRAGNNEESAALLEEARQVEKSAGPLFVETKDTRRAIKQRLANFNKSRVVFEQKQAAKLEKIERLEDINSDALMTAARQGRTFLNKLDGLTEEEFAKEASKFRSMFAELGERYDAVVERIGKLTQDETAELGTLLQLEGKQEKLSTKLDSALGRLEQAEDFQAAVPVFRDIIEEQLGVVLDRINKNMTNRTLRAQRLTDQAKTLDPELVLKRVDELKMNQSAKRDEFFDAMRARGADVDFKTLAADFKEYSRALAIEAKDKIIGTHLRSATVDTIASERGSELARALNVPSLDIQKFLVTDIDKLLHQQIRTLAPDIEIMRKFGTVDWGKIIQPVVEEYNVRLEQFKDMVDKAKIKLADPSISAAERTKLEKFISLKNIEKNEASINDAFFAAKRDLEAVHDRLRHTWGLPDDAEAIGYRLGKTALKLNVLRLMGGTVVTSIAETGRPIMKHGLTRVFGDGFGLMVKDFQAFKASAREVRLAGAGLDTVLHSRSQALMDVITDYATTSKFERGVDFATSKMGIINMLDPWTSALKQFNGVITNARLLDSVDALMTGKATQKELAEATTFLASHGFNDKLIRGVWAEMNNGGADKVKGTWLPNTENWKDKDLVRAFRAAVVKNADDTIVTPGVELPLTMNRTIANRMLFQFKSFGMSSTYKTVAAGMQQRDMAVLQGVMVSLAMGALSYYTYAVLAGGKTEEIMRNADVAKWADEAYQRSGVGAAFADAQKLAERLPYVGKYTTASGLFGDGQRLQQNAGNNLVESMLGPSFGFAKTLAEGVAGLEEPTQATLHKFRTLLPFQNLTGFRRLLDQVEQASGLPERKN